MNIQLSVMIISLLVEFRAANVLLLLHMPSLLYPHKLSTIVKTTPDYETLPSPA